MKNRKMLLTALFSIALIFSLIVPAAAVGASATVPLPDDRFISHLAADSASLVSAMVLNTPQGKVTPMVAAGSYHTVGLKSDGTVVALGNNAWGECEVGNWTDIVQVAAGAHYTVGLKSDGTLVAAGNNYDGQCNVSNWTDITQVAAGGSHTVGLKKDGTVVALGTNGYGQCNVSNWTDITQVVAGGGYTAVDADGVTLGDYSGRGHTVGLKKDGTVVAVGNNEDGRCEVGNWTDIIQVTAGRFHTVGLKSDGTVIAVGDFGHGNVGGWENIAQVGAGSQYTVGLKKDGTVIEVGGDCYAEQCNVGGWTDIVRVAAGWYHKVGLKSDGTVLAVGEANSYGQCNVGGWNLVLAVPQSQYILTISSTAGGSVTTPGQGTFVYDEGTVVDLVADLVAETGELYRFVEWTGDVGTISNVTATATNITMDGDYAITANFEYAQEIQVGIKAGDWIKMDYTITGWPAGQPYPEWLKVEFLSVEGTSANTSATMHMSDGTEQSDAVPVDVVAGGGEAFGLSGAVISANLTTGDSIYMTGYGNVTIEGETTRTYAGARRTVVYASISQSIPYQGEVQLTYYWDKLTGVVVEASTTYGGMTATAKATETNMWEATTIGMRWWIWVIIAVAIGAVAFVVYRLKKRKTPTTPTPPAERT